MSQNVARHPATTEAAERGAGQMTAARRAWGVYTIKREKLYSDMVRHQLRSHWKVDHVGHVVTDLGAAESDFVERLGFSVEVRETLPEHRVEVAFLSLAGLTLELLVPLPGNTSLAKFLEKRGPGLHHIAFSVPSVSGELATLAAEGIELIDKHPRPGARGHQVAFLHPNSTQHLLIELCGPF